MYDLVYANFNNEDFNPHKQYAYFRKYKDELILCVVNFGDRGREVEINIPAETFQYLDLPEDNYYNSVNLLNEDEEFPVQQLSSKVRYRVFVPAWEGKILKLTKVKAEEK